MLDQLKSAIKSCIPTLKNALPFLFVIIAILLNVAIWWAGPWIVIDGEKVLTSASQRGLASFILSLSCVALWGLFQWKKLHQIEKEQAHEKKIEDDPILRFEEKQEIELTQIMQGMKESLSKRNYLYALPWYVVIGFEHSGKTALLNRSGQHFVFSSVMRASGKKSENPYTYNWWISDNAVLIDPDGQLLSQGAISAANDTALTRRLWLHFIHWLENIRSRRPLNGVVITLDIAQLATAATHERLAYANMIRARLRELMETLSTRMPVYIVMTKLDLLTGFEAFFKHYSKEEREAVLGFTFNLNEKSDLDQWLDDFDEDYQSFMALMNRNLSRVLAKAEGTEERDAIFSFTRQMAGLHEVLTLFFKDALSSDQFSTSALVRGVYFTSVYQVGISENAFIDAACRRYELPSLVNAAQRVTNSTTYFTQHLFSQIIYPESGLASDNFRVAKRKRHIMTLSSIACGIAFVLLAGTWHRYYLKNTQSADAVLLKVNYYRENFSDQQLARLGAGALDPLDAIREATLEFGFFRQMPKYISDLGLYQGHKIGPSVENTYLNLLETLFIPELVKDVIHDLSNARDDTTRLELLRIYRMLVDKTGRYERLVQNYFAHIWQKRYAGKRDVQDKLMQHLDYAMTHTNVQANRAAGSQELERLLSPYDSIVLMTQEKLNRLPVAERVYKNLKQIAADALGAPLNIASAIGPVFDIVFFVQPDQRNRIKIPQILTKEGLDSYFLSKSESVAELALVDRWVLGQTNNIDFSEQDKIELRDSIRRFYVADYVNTWRQAMNAINLHYFSDIKKAGFIFENINGSAQPLTRLLTVITDNTYIFPDVLDGAAKKEFEDSAQYKMAAMIDRQFASVNSIKKTREGQPSYLNEITSGISQLQALLKGINDSPEMGRAALKITKDRIGLQNADPIYQLERVSENLPTPFSAILNKLATDTWFVIKQEAIQYLGERWKADIYNTYYEKFAHRYPFDPDSKRDVALTDFESFFSPNGKLATFYNENLKMFVEEGKILSEDASGKSVISHAVIEQLKKVGGIQDAFFNRKGNVDVQFILEPIEMSANKRRGVITVDGQVVDYNHGPKRYVGLVWPNILRDTVMSKVTLVPDRVNRSPRSIETMGSWAFFRLLDKAEVVSITESSVDYRFTIDKGEITYRLYSEESVNPFTSTLFKGFKLSSSLY